MAANADNLFSTGVGPSSLTGLGSELESALADVLVNRLRGALSDGRGLFTMAGPLLLAVNPGPGAPPAEGEPPPPPYAAPHPGGATTAASVFHGSVMWRYYTESERAAGNEAFGTAPGGRGRGRMPPPRPSATATLPPHVFVRFFFFCCAC